VAWCWRYLFVSPSAQGDAWVVDQAGRKREAHRVGVWEAVHMGMGVDAIITHVSGSGCWRHWGGHVRAQRDTVLRLCLRLPVIERSHARESSRVRSVRVGWD